MNYLFYLGHPAHYHLFKNIMSDLSQRGHTCTIICRKKDVLVDLLEQDGWGYYNILPQSRHHSRLDMVRHMIIKIVRITKIALKVRPDMLVGTSAAITHVGKLLKIPSIVVNEDDAEAIPLFAGLAYPFASYILTPKCCSVGSWQNRQITYNGNHELAYLHPNRFQPRRDILEQMGLANECYFVLRLAKLTSYHDHLNRGITDQIAERLIDLLSPYGRILISSERPLPASLAPFQLNLKPRLLHHILAFARFYVGDSQTMAAEAAILGTPAIRFNDFIGQLGYLDELEYDFGLVEGIHYTQSDRLYHRVDQWLKDPELKSKWDLKRRRFLAEKIDVTDFFVWLFELLATETVSRSNLYTEYLNQTKPKYHPHPHLSPQFSGPVRL